MALVCVEMEFMVTVVDFGADCAVLDDPQGHLQVTECSSDCKDNSPCWCRRVHLLIDGLAARGWTWPQANGNMGTCSFFCADDGMLSVRPTPPFLPKMAAPSYVSAGVVWRMRSYAVQEVLTEALFAVHESHPGHEMACRKPVHDLCHSHAMRGQVNLHTYLQSCTYVSVV